MSFTWLSKGILLALIVLSVTLFAVRFGRVLRRIFEARPDPDFKLGSVAHRIGQFLWEVMLQAKVIRERPLPGLAHAFVFWSFCAFALVTINHFALPFGAAFLDRHASAWGAAYWWFAFAFAAACALSIAGLAFRRFVIRPRWLEPLSPESGIIAGLIFLLMVTYMPMWWLSESSPAGRTVWWIHSLTILAFLPLIPHTKHLHLILSPFTIFLDRRGFSHIPPLSGDEDFGLVSGKDISKVVALQAYSCVECGRCTEHCPANNTGKELNPKLIVLGLRSYLNEYGNANETPILSATVSQKAIFQCTTCGSCEYQCPVGIQHLPAIIGLRRGAVNTGTWEDEYGTKLFLTLERNGNALGFSASERDKFVSKQQFPVYDGSQDYCLWLGCMGAYDPQGREIITAFASVMNHLGTSYGVLKKERCTGDPVRRLGNDLLFQQLAEINIDNFRQAKVTKLVSICPHCVRTIGEDWREFGVAFEIEHHSEFLARHADKLPQSRDGRQVVFHDPCYLGRYRGVYDAPRDVIARSAEVIDPPRSRERSFCCGAGGGLVFLGEETGDRVNRARAAELVKTGAPVVGAACPFCSSMFRDALAAVTDQPPRLLDIAQIAAESLKARAPQ
jgi:Fe-S oxidoreductase